MMLPDPTSPSARAAFWSGARVAPGWAPAAASGRGRRRTRRTAWGQAGWSPRSSGRPGRPEATEPRGGDRRGSGPFSGWEFGEHRLDGSQVGWGRSGSGRERMHGPPSRSEGSHCTPLAMTCTRGRTTGGGSMVGGQRGRREYACSTLFMFLFMLFGSCSMGGAVHVWASGRGGGRARSGRAGMNARAGEDGLSGAKGVRPVRGWAGPKWSPSRQGTEGVTKTEVNTRQTPPPSTHN